MRTGSECVRWIALMTDHRAVYAGNFLWKKLPTHKISGAPFATPDCERPDGELHSSKGQLRQGSNEILIEFRDRTASLLMLAT